MSKAANLTVKALGAYVGLTALQQGLGVIWKGRTGPSEMPRYLGLRRRSPRKGSAANNQTASTTRAVGSANSTRLAGKVTPPTGTVAPTSHSYAPMSA